MKKMLRKIPKFENEQQEREFWQTHDSTEYVAYTSLQNWRFPNLKLTSKPITIRLPEVLIDRIKIKAHMMDIPYQTFIKQLIHERMTGELL